MAGDARETQREPTPRVGGDETEIGLAFLGFARRCVCKKLDGLDDAAVRRTFVPSGTTLLGLVQHLTASEHYWFGYHVAGEPLGAPHDDRFFSMTVDPDRSTADVLAAYRAAADRSDAIVRAVGDLAAPAARPLDGEVSSVRWVLTHMTTETTRHAGHADVLRELTDGVTGR